MGFLNRGMIQDKVYQITPQLKFRYFLFLILFPIILPVIIISKNIYITILAVIILLWISRVLLDVPNSVSGLTPYTMFKPFATFRSFKKMFKPDEDDLKAIPKLNLIFSISLPFYIFNMLMQYLIVLVLLLLLSYSIFVK